MFKKVLFFVFFALYSINASAGIVILNGLSHSYKVENGQVYKGSVEIENTGNETQNVKLFLQDLHYNSEGNIQYMAPNALPRSNASWIKLNTNLLQLKSKEKTVVRYEITVPQSLSQTGTYWSVLIVEPVEEIKASNQTAGISINSIVRYAIQIIADYRSEEGNPEFVFDNVRVDNQGRKKYLKLAISNKGNLFSKTIATVEIYNRKTGEKLGTFSSIPLGLLPGTSKTFDIDISTIPVDKYKAVIFATDEDENAFALNVDLEVK